MKNCAILVLYGALCNSDGLAEGRFYSDAEKGRELQRYLDGMKIVLESLDESKYLRIPAKISQNSLCKTDDGANKIIEHAKKNISGSNDIIRLIDCEHGTIKFRKEIDFDGWTNDGEQELIERLQNAATCRQT
ncbi:hypothetical protein HYZ41_03430 [archaeon]|nr:hypothetical protein [archaeon]